MPIIVYEDEPLKKRPSPFLIIALLLCLSIAIWWFTNGNPGSSEKEADSISEDELKGTCYHYSQLENDEKAIYRAIYKCCTEFGSEISIVPISMEKCERAVCALRNDHPEFYWINAVTTTSDQNDLANNVSFIVPQDAKEKSEQLKIKADSILSTAPQDEYEKVRYIYEYIIGNTEYNINAPDNQTAYSALIGKSSVCGGYSNAFQYLCDRAGIYCGYITGEIIGKEKHAWNFVKLNSQFYWVDTTWGDPSYPSSLKGYENIFYDYLCATDEELLPSRILSNNPSYSDYKSYINFTYPSCTDRSLNYYVKAGTMIDTYSRPAIYNNVIMQVSDFFKDLTVIKFGSEEAFNEAVDDLFETGEYWDQIVHDLVMYYRIDAESLQVMTIAGNLHHLIIKKQASL